MTQRDAAIATEPEEKKEEDRGSVLDVDPGDPILTAVTRRDPPCQGPADSAVDAESEANGETFGEAIGSVGEAAGSVLKNIVSGIVDGIDI